MTVAESLRSCSWTIDVACRYGGEEFAVIAPDTRSSDAVVLADRLRARVCLAHAAELRWPLTVSVGYDAKRSGRVRTFIADIGGLMGRA